MEQKEYAGKMSERTRSPLQKCWWALGIPSQFGLEQGTRFTRSSSDPSLIAEHRGWWELLQAYCCGGPCPRRVRHNYTVRINDVGNVGIVSVGMMATLWKQSRQGCKAMEPQTFLKNEDPLLRALQKPESGLPSSRHPRAYVTGGPHRLQSTSSTT